MARTQERWAQAKQGACTCTLTGPGTSPGTGVVVNLIVIVVPYRSISVVLWKASPSTEIRYNQQSMIALASLTNASSTKWMKLMKNAYMEPGTDLKENAGCEGARGGSGVRQPKVGVHAGWRSEEGRECRRAAETITET